MPVSANVDCNWDEPNKESKMQFTKIFNVKIHHKLIILRVLETV